MLPSKTNLVANGRILAVHHGSNPVLKLNLCPFHRLNQLVDPGFIIGSWMSGHNNPKFTFWGVLHRHTTCNSRARSSMSSSRPSSPKHDKEDDRTPPSEPELKCSLTGEKVGVCRIALHTVPSMPTRNLSVLRMTLTSTVTQEMKAWLKR